MIFIVGNDINVFIFFSAPAVAVGRSVQTWQSHLKFQAELANPKNLKG